MNAARSPIEDPQPDNSADQAAGNPESVARLICLRALGQRDRTRAELSTLLARRGVPAEAAQLVLDRFGELGLINDAGLAESFAAAAHAERGLSRRAVALKLRHRGVDEQTVQDAVRDIDADSEEAAARAVALRRIRSLSGLDRAVQARRLVGLLARRGYSPSLCSRVVRDVLDLDAAAGEDT